MRRQADSLCSAMSRVAARLRPVPFAAGCVDAGQSITGLGVEEEVRSCCCIVGPVVESLKEV